MNDNNKDTNNNKENEYFNIMTSVDKINISSSEIKKIIDNFLISKRLLVRWDTF